MSIKIPQEYLGYDFGFTGVDESEIKQDVLQALDEKHQELTDKEQQLLNKMLLWLGCSLQPGSVQRQHRWLPDRGLESRRWP
jgi:hypothetical protein